MADDFTFNGDIMGGLSAAVGMIGKGIAEAVDASGTFIADALASSTAEATPSAAVDPSTVKENTQLYNNSDPISVDTLNESQRLVDLAKNALIIGSGVGMSWYALKKLVERAYRRRLADTIREDSQVVDTYQRQTTPISNEFITKQSSVRPSASDLAGIQEKDLSDPDILGNNNYVLLPKTDWSPAHIAAKNSWLFSPVIGMSIPALLALGTWGGSAAAKQIVKHITPEKEYSLDAARIRAKRRYDTAAKLLRDVAAGRTLKKRSSARFEKNATLLGLLGRLALIGGGAFGIAAGANGIAKYNQEKDERDAAPGTQPLLDGDLTEHSSLNTLAGLAALTGAALLTVPAYRFVQSMRSGYKNRTQSLSDVVRSAQAWEALRRSRDYNYASLRAALRDEPDLGFSMDPVEEAEFKQKPNTTFTI